MSSETKALVGFTGFVGGNLAQMTEFNGLYNSQNIGEIRGKSYSHVVISAVQAKKWWANQHPHEDWSAIERLLMDLSYCKAEKVTLISTIDVLGLAAGLSEIDSPDIEKLTSYGLHRLKLEGAVRSQFQTVLVVRLPGLFGSGLKKNVIFDLLHHNALDQINPRSSYQYYDLKSLWSDIQISWTHALELVHLFPEPVQTTELLEAFFPGSEVGANAAPEAHYDHRTVHGPIFGGDERYIANKARVMEQLLSFIQAQRSLKS